MIFLRIITTVPVVFATVAVTLRGTGSKGNSKRPSNDAKARCKEPSIFTGKSGDFKEWLFTFEDAIGIFQPIYPVGYAASFLEGSARQWLIAWWFDGGRTSTWQKLQKKIQEAFAFEHQDKHDRQRLVRMRQGSDLRDFIYEFNSRCLAARDLDELTKTVLFIEGLLDVEV